MATSSAAARYVVEASRFTEEHEEALTVKEMAFPTMRIKKTRLFKAIQKKEWVSMPREYGIAAFGQPDIDMRVDAAPMDRLHQWKGPPLYDYQQGAIAAMASVNAGIISLSCGGGKTNTALYLLSQVWRCRALIVVHQSALMVQWEERIHQVLPSASVHRIQGTGTVQFRAEFVIAMAQTLSPRAEVLRTELAAAYCVVVDEAHHCPSKTFRSCCETPCRRRLGLTATPKRTDGFPVEPYLGEVRFRYTRPQVVEVRQIPAPPLRMILPEEPAHRTTALSEHATRNEALAALVRRLNARGDRVLVLGARVQQLRDLSEPWIQQGQGSLVVGSTKAKDRDTDTFPCFCSTAIAGEGLDCAANVLVFATPIGKNRNLLQQTSGRVTRQQDSRGTIYDLVDDDPVLNQQAATRAGMWRRMGFEVVVEASGAASGEAATEATTQQLFKFFSERS